MKRIGVPSPASSTWSFTPSLVVIIVIGRPLFRIAADRSACVPTVADQCRGWKLGHDLAVSDHRAAGGNAAVDGHHRAGDVAGPGRSQERDEIGDFLGGGGTLGGIFVEQLFPAALVAEH